MSGRSYKVYTASLFRDVSFGRCRKIAVSSVDGKRRLLAIFMSIMTKKVSLDDHYSHKPHVHVLYDGLQRMAALLN